VAAQSRARGRRGPATHQANGIVDNHGIIVRMISYDKWIEVTITECSSNQTTHNIRI
jgi:hypothetical protein